MTTRIRAAVAVALALAVTTAGCGFVQNARTVVDSATILGEFVGMLGQAPELGYTAGYSTSGGRAVTMARSPARTAYLVSGGRLVVTPEQLLRCATAGCERAPNPGGDVEPLVGAVTGAGFVTPEAVLATVATAAFTKGTSVKTSTAMILDRPVQCGDVKGPERTFSLCLTEDGVVASYRDQRGSMDLRSYATGADAAAFVPPPGAPVVDVPSLR